MLRLRDCVATAVFVIGSALASTAGAQPFGVEMHNNLMLAAGGMGGRRQYSTAGTARRHQRQPRHTHSVRRYSISVRRRMDRGNL